MCIRAVEVDLWQLYHVSDQYKTQEMCKEIVCTRPGAFFIIPDRFKIQDMCDKVVACNPHAAPCPRSV